MKKFTILTLLILVLVVWVIGCGGGGGANGTGTSTTGMTATTSTTTTTGTTAGGTTGSTLPRYTVSSDTQINGYQIAPATVLGGANGVQFALNALAYADVAGNSVQADAGFKIVGANGSAPNIYVWEVDSLGNLKVENRGSSTPHFTTVAAGYTFQAVVPGAQPVAIVSNTSGQLFNQFGTNAAPFASKLAGQTALAATTSEVTVVNNGTVQTQSALDGSITVSYKGLASSGGAVVLGDANQLLVQNSGKNYATYYDGTTGAASTLPALVTTDTAVIPTGVLGNTVFGLSNNVAVVWTLSGSKYVATKLSQQIDGTPPSSTPGPTFVLGGSIYITYNGANAILVYPATKE